jgi:hypothetical protein
MSTTTTKKHRKASKPSKSVVWRKAYKLPKATDHDYWEKIWKCNDAAKRNELWWKDCIIEREKKTTTAFLETDDWMEEIFAFLETTDLFN